MYAPYIPSPISVEGDVFRIVVKVSQFGRIETKEEATNQVTGEVTPGVSPEVTPEVKAHEALGAGGAGTKLALSRHQVAILHKCSEDSMLVDIMAITGRSDRTKFRHQVLNPLLEAGLIEMTIPDKPRSSKQKCLLTNAGKHLLKPVQE